MREAPDTDFLTGGEFSDREFEAPDVQRLPADPAVAEII